MNTSTVIDQFKIISYYMLFVNIVLLSTLFFMEGLVGVLVITSLMTLSNFIYILYSLSILGYMTSKVSRLELLNSNHNKKDQIQEKWKKINELCTTEEGKKVIAESLERVEKIKKKINEDRKIRPEIFKWRFKK